MEFCVLCRQPVWLKVWGRGNGKRLYIRSKKGFKPVSVVHDWCVGKFETTRLELATQYEKMSKAIESLSERVNSGLEKSVRST